MGLADRDSSQLASQRLAFTESIAVYRAGHILMTEEMTPLPEDSHGIARLVAARMGEKITTRVRAMCLNIEVSKNLPPKLGRSGLAGQPDSPCPLS